MTGIAMEAAAEEENNATMAGKRGLSPIIVTNTHYPPPARRNISCWMCS
jgi:hypothetical protein